MTTDKIRELQQLLGANDEDFVRLAYQLILGREADPEGLGAYVGQLRQGQDRRTIAADIAHSQEGLARGQEWAALLPLTEDLGGGGMAAWWRSRLFGGQLTELRRGVARLENQVYRLRKEVAARPAVVERVRDTAPADESAPARNAEAAAPAPVPITSALLGRGGARPQDRSWPAALRRTVHLSAGPLQRSERAPGGRRILLDGHISGSYSLAITNRELVQSLMRHGHEVDVAVQPREHQPTDEIKDLPGGEDSYRLFRELLARGKSEAFRAGPVLRLYHAWPPVEHERRDGEAAVAVFFWEESLIPAEIIERFNRGYDGIIVTTWFVKKALIDNGCTVPIELTPFPHELHGGNEVQEPARRGDRSFIEFLHVSSCFARKGPEALLRAFNEVALQLPQVRLTIKTFENPHLEIRDQVARFIDPTVADRVRLLIADLSDTQMAELYRSADALVLPTRGEGLNMPVIEGAYFRLPVIATGYTGQADFLTPDTGWSVDFDFEPSRSHLGRDGSLWCEPRHADLAQAMGEVARKLMTAPERVWARADRLNDVVHETFLHARATWGFELALDRLLKTAKNRAAPTATAPRVCILSSWMETCGIAEYSAFLARALQGQGVAVSINAPENERSVEASPFPAVKGHWRQGLYFRVEGAELDADVVWFQHHPAFYQLGDDVTRAVKALARRGIPSFITLHSTKELLKNTGGIVGLAACLQEFERVVVHSAADRNMLRLCGVTHNVVVIPHGVETAARSAGAPLRAGRPLLIGCFGFLLQHKGVDRLIEMLGCARRTPGAPALRLRLINAVRGDEESRNTLAHCRRLAKELGVEDAIEWHTDFLPNERVMSLLADCDIAMLPYQPTTESASGAVRQALSACAHVLVSRQPIFDELRHCTYTVDASGGESLLASMQAFIGQAGAEADLARLAAREQWLAARSWPQVAAGSLSLMRACLTDVHYTRRWLRHE